jgi:subtilisin family serine protease
LSKRCRALLIGLCLALPACAPLDRQPNETLAIRGTTERQILVMLRLPPPHFRPDADYASGYPLLFGHNARRRIAEELADEHNLKLIADWPMLALGVDCFVMEVQTDRATAPLLERLAQDPRVESVQPMNVFQVLGHNDPLYPLQPSAKLWHLSDVHETATGKDVLIAEIDTGVEVNHPDLDGRVALARNFVDGSPYVAETHGTAVAGIIAARADDGIGIAGVAPQAKLIALRACWQESSTSDGALCSSFTLAKALQFALDQNVQVINLSLGGPRDRLLERLMNVALAHGVTIVAAADPQIGNGGFPASHAGVLAVSAEETGDLPAVFLLAPGRDIPATIPGGRWSFVAGSSFAAAHVTGMVALVRELIPRIKPSQVRDALAPVATSGLATARPAMIDACAAIARAAGTCACACAVTREARSLPSR